MEDRIELQRLERVWSDETRSPERWRRDEERQSSVAFLFVKRANLHRESVTVLLLSQDTRDLQLGLLLLAQDPQDSVCLCRPVRGCWRRP